MPLPSILRKASSYILGDGNQDNRRSMYQDGEALFCKNNVCVHPPTLLRQHCDVVHHPGYMTLTCKFDKNTNVPTLHLSWIPNSTLRKHPTTLENLTPKKHAIGSHSHDKILEESNGGKLNDNERVDVCLEVKEPINCSDCERVCSGGTSTISAGTGIISSGTSNTSGGDERQAKKDGESVLDKSMVIKLEDVDLELGVNRERKVKDFGVVDDMKIETRSLENENGETIMETGKLRGTEGNISNQGRVKSLKMHRLRSDSLDSRVFENGSGMDRRNLLDDVFKDDVSVKSRSMSLTSTCSLNIGGSTDGNHCK